MIEQALFEHLKAQDALKPYLATYNDAMAIFNQEAPGDTDALWNKGPQYGRIVFAVDLQGDPERSMGGTLAVDIMCADDDYPPEEVEPIIRSLIHGYFFSSGTFAVAAQWKNSTYFTQPTDSVIGCTLTFDLLGFPVLTTSDPDIIARFNKWTSDTFPGIHVINHDTLPTSAWKPSPGESAAYWRLVTDSPAGWIPDTFQTVWRIAHLKCHIFAADNAAALEATRNISTWLHINKRIMKEGESPIMVNRRNNVDLAADPLRTGQLTVEATYGIIVRYAADTAIKEINYEAAQGPSGSVDADYGFELREDGTLICTPPPSLSDEGVLSLE